MTARTTSRPSGCSEAKTTANTVSSNNRQIDYRPSKSVLLPALIVAVTVREQQRSMQAACPSLAFSEVTVQAEMLKLYALMHNTSQVLLQVNEK